jgi:hypothetical protein
MIRMILINKTSWLETKNFLIDEAVQECIFDIELVDLP